MSDESQSPTAAERPGAIADTEPVPGEHRPSIADAAGKTGGSFSDRYQPGDELGRGGMGRVVEARDRMLGRTVAVKEALDTDADALRRFARETQITARLEHPAIVPVYDAGVSPDGSPFYVMRKVTGRPLDKLVNAADRLDDRLALLPHVMAACQAIAHAHERGIIHRDLKPSNILVGARGETVVIDWGLAKALDETDSIREPTAPSSGDSLRTRVGTVFGTPGFMSPEQLASSDVDERADVYALGATLFYMLAKRAPHTTTEIEAVRPAPPIASIVPGVPRELATIVDKALSFDLAVRYPNAGALAEELVRFMTGQLVASHAYSRREKLARFVRRHRALVITVGAALAVLAVGAWIAVGRVLSARDEAIAQARAADTARASETERASDLVVSQARLLLASNPAAAVAMVRPLAKSSRWREVRAVAAGARAAGVPWRLPGPKTVRFVDMSPDGKHAIVSGVDGTLHYYDLAARKHEVIATLTGRVRATFADDRYVVAWVDNTFTIIDTTTRTTRTLTRPEPILRAAGHGGTLYFTDAKHHAWRLTAATGDVLGIPIEGKVTYVAPSPDGKHVAFSGDHLWMIEAKRPDLVDVVHQGKKFDLAWAANGDQLAVIGDKATYQITVHPEIEITELGTTNQSIALARGLLYSMGMGGFTIGERVTGSADLQSSLVGLHVTKGEFVVAAGRTSMRVLDGRHAYEVPLPAAPLASLRASPRSPYVLAVAVDLVLLWNVDHFMPARHEVPSYTQLATVGARSAWTITSNGEGGRAIDIRTGEQRAIGKLPPLRFASPSSGAYMIARPLASKETLVLDHDGKGGPIAIDAATSTVLDDKRAVIATTAGEIVLYEIAAKTSRKLGTFDAKIDRILTREKSARWIVATFVDGTLWRHDLSTSTSTTTKIAPRTEASSPGFVTTAATTTGEVLLAEEAQLRRWKPDGTVEDFTALPRPVFSLELIDDTRVVAISDEGSAYLIDLAKRGFVKLPQIGLTHSFTPGSPILVSDDRTGGVTVVDIDANAAWKIARAAPQGSTPAITSDGTSVVMRDATMDSTAVAVWHLDLPTTPEATATWIEGMTNASFDPRTGMIGWPP